MLQVLSSVRPAWTLTGGAALAGVHTGHRATRDLDLFWQGARQLGAIPQEVEAQLVAAGLSVTRIETSPSFVRLSASDASTAVVLDLVADPVPLAEPPMRVSIEGVEVLVDTRHQILVNKLCAVLSRSELRDLSDVQALISVGGDLPRALTDAGHQDGGFSPLNLAWVLREFPVRALAEAEGLSAEEAQALEGFRAWFAERVAREGTP
ncbi:MAG: nucleotidyl transferase AbiEii/AbiGii toxin family protein [Deltaproteobacteria bacterium]|nr:nucleotidyl transferase AbiEii/AbiGii toxin family protein [Deltaproteobacteria bacterium]